MHLYPVSGHIARGRTSKNQQKVDAWFTANHISKFIKSQKHLRFPDEIKTAVPQKHLDWGEDCHTFLFWYNYVRPKAYSAK